jgi:hypothetical protein
MSSRPNLQFITSSAVSICCISAWLSFSGCFSQPVPPANITTAAPPVTISTPAPVTPLPDQPRGEKDPDFITDIYIAELAFNGTTLLGDNHNPEKPRIIEVNMRGEIVWQHQIPFDLRRFTNPGFDAERLLNNNILFTLPGYGIFEIDRSGKTVWSCRDNKISHDADRLPNDNILYAFGNNDSHADAQAKEITRDNTIVWQWKAGEYFNTPDYSPIWDMGWTHANAVSRLENGNTLVSLRNFNFIVEVSSSGTILRTIGKSVLRNQHDPAMLPDGTIILANHGNPQSALILDPATNAILWNHVLPAQLIRDADKLPNGNILITGSSLIVEITPDKKVAWKFGLTTPLTREQFSGRGFYKSQRIGASN